MDICEVLAYQMSITPRYTKRLLVHPSKRRRGIRSLHGGYT